MQLGGESVMSASPFYRMQFMMCAGTGCMASGSLDVRDALEKELAKRNLQDEVQIIMTGCNGFCAMGPLVVVYPEGIFYNQVKPEHAPLIVEEHVLKGRIVEKLLFKEELAKDRVPLMKDIAFFGLQRLIVLRNRGLIDAENIDEYIARDGYAALAKVLEQMTPEEVIEEVKKSGLRGRGGGGFPTGLKWEECRRYESFPKFSICNGDEGDPGAFMDRSVMEGDPHSVLEGMAISGYAIGAEKGYIYVRAEYPLAIQRLQKAIHDALDYGLLGTDILGKGFNFDIEIYPGAGAFVCGESTALMYSIEGKRGMPRIKPPRSAEAGLWNQPTNLNNVETFANLNPLILNGGEWFASIGTEGSKGTKVFALTGAVNNVGLVEVPMGTTLKSLIFDIGGGIPKKRKFKAAQIGGPSGGCIPTGMEDVEIDYESLTGVGAMMGSGGVVVMDDATCMVDTARFFIDFSVEESCGKCTPCREGLKVMLEKLTDIVEGRGQEGDLEFLIELGHHVNGTSHCGLGKSAANPVLSTIRYFRHEYDAHIRDKHCPALVCPNLIDFVVLEDKCKMCGLCYRNCPSEAITWEKKKVARIDLEKCTKCRTCITNCRFGAIR
jgi:NADH:ubiquinone oxidoreductase subunit F (NADH-binding)/(2Fe-2S) ferredoxin/NAD-dependent dihydropyrimidine dehydrogenase PreA subunit